MKKLLTAVILLSVFASCKKESDNLQLTSINDYAPLAKGKYITYSLDSLNFGSFGTTQIHTFYQVKYEVTDAITDILGRPAFRITRYIKPVSSGSFTADNTFLAVNAGNTYEFTENNLRFLKLALPIKEAGTWKGNSAIDVTSLGSSEQYLYDWDYTYANVGASAQVGTTTFPETITVNQHDDEFNLPVVLPGPGVSNPTNIASKDYSQEIYAKGIGMVYKNFIHWEYQLAFNGYQGYGIKLTMIDHN